MKTQLTKSLPLVSGLSPGTGLHGCSELSPRWQQARNRCPFSSPDICQVKAWGGKKPANLEIIQGAVLEERQPDERKPQAVSLAVSGNRS